MKKLFFLFCFFMGAWACSFAQDYSFGFTGGVSFANIRNKVPGHADHSDSKAGFTLGAFVEYAYNAHFGFQPALHFVQKGGKGKEGTFTYDYRFNYLEVPLNFLYYFKSKGARFFVGAGPWFAAGIGGKATTNDGTGAKSRDLQFGTNDAKDDFKTFDLGADALVGCKLTGGFLISAGYSVGLHSITFHNDKLMNYYYSAKIGYTLPAKKPKK
jgi:hypothetical protein